MSNNKGGTTSLNDKKISIAFEYLQRGYFDKALVFFQEIINEDPNNKDAFLGKMLCEKKVKTIEGLGYLIYEKENCEQLFKDLKEENRNLLLKAMAKQAISDKGSIYGIVLAFLNYNIEDKKVFIDEMFTYSLDNVDERMFEYLIKYKTNEEVIILLGQLIPLLKKKGKANLYEYIDRLFAMTPEVDFELMNDFINKSIIKSDTVAQVNGKCENFDKLVEKYTDYRMDKVILTFAENLISFEHYDKAKKYYELLITRNSFVQESLKGLLFCRTRVKKLADLEKYRESLASIKEFNDLLLASDKRGQTQLLNLVDKQSAYLSQQQQIEEDARKLLEIAAVQKEKEEKRKKQELQAKRRNKRRFILGNLITIVISILSIFIGYSLYEGGSDFNFLNISVILTLGSTIANMVINYKRASVSYRLARLLILFSCLLFSLAVYLNLNSYSFELNSHFLITEISNIDSDIMLPFILLNLWILIPILIILNIYYKVYSDNYEVVKSVFLTIVYSLLALPPAIILLTSYSVLIAEDNFNAYLIIASLLAGFILRKFNKFVIKMKTV